MDTKVIVRLPSELRDAVAEKAQLEGLTISLVIRQLLKAYTEGKIEIGVK